MVEEYDYLFKTIVVGDGGVGKTALTIRFSKDFFTEDYKMTIGVDFHVKTIKIDTSEGEIRCKLQIWDTGGQERFSSIRPMYYRGSLGALVIYDLTNYESFEHLPQWIEEIRANIKNEIPLLLVGNKSDLTEQRAVSMEEINDFTRKFNLYYMETSAKTGDGVGDCFQILAGLMIGSGVPDKLISDGTVYSPGNLLVSPKAEPEFELTAPPAPKPSSTIISEPVPAFEPESSFEPEPAFEPEPEFTLTTPPAPEPSPIIIPEPEPAFELEPEIDFAAPPVPEPQPKEVIDPAPIFEPEPEIKFDAPPVPEPTKEEEQKPILTSLPEPSPESEMYKPKTVPFSQNTPVPAPTPEGFQLPKALETSSSSSKGSAPFIPTTPSQPSSSESLFDYMPETTISKKEKKELEKQKKLEEKERKIQEEKEAKEAARLEKERKIQEEKENKERQLREAKDAKVAARLEKERKIREEKEDKQRQLREAKEAKEAARLEKERKAQEAREAKEAAKMEKKKKGKDEVPEQQPDMFQVAFPTSKPKEESSLFQALTQKPGDSTKDSLFTAFTSSEKSEPSKLRIIPNVADIDNFSNPLPPVPTVQDKSSKRRETIVCKQCGSVLSSDYAFCNKCGSAL